MLKEIKTYVRVLIFSTVVFISSYGQTIPYTTGRIVISSDGNEHDHDDWAATPFSLAMLSAKKLQDSLTVYTFSDHIWRSNHVKTHGKEQMLISALEGKVIYNFNQSNFIEAVSYPTEAIDAITQEINKSHKNSPLTIIAAGPMHVVGSAIYKADASKLKFVRIISHSRWNDQHADKPDTRWEHHAGWTWKEIQKEFEPKGLIVDHILDQNGGDGYYGMKAPKHLFDWIKNSPIRNKSKEVEKQLDWLYSRQLTCVKKEEFDPSDAGMIIYLLTGVQKTNPSDARAIIEHQF